jgi:hypothetical protein
MIEEKKKSMYLHVIEVEMDEKGSSLHEKVSSLHEKTKMQANNYRTCLCHAILLPIISISFFVGNLMISSSYGFGSWQSVLFLCCIGLFSTFLLTFVFYDFSRF